ncbi:MAG: DUF5024 domain-containing protein [Alistipes sp.]|nr:DUF5024 domain-containing protein [Alistipes sp.]
MKRLIFIVALLVAAVAECSAQERIEALLKRDMQSNKYGQGLRVAVKRDRETGEIIKRVTELTVIDDKALAKEFIEAFKAERDTADVWEEEANGKIYLVTAVWSDPKRIYRLDTNGSLVTVYEQIIYKEE